ncbi:hypothetical protein NBT05_06385 [Aquimarina sp. ERC-38]|uniref:hypothetical protein n=1 Tax=Aquimarina sp. ERC-38 TaxID=2949996 RepID=UPI002246ADDB|nr:hypothetical protein [Aquimarina sp. ERC-38]UZO82096.1 hypothetical protein NBT05_06385 [Aquimarina sp. ERC-38]
MVYLRNRIVNRYINIRNDDEKSKEIYEKFRYLIDSPFPPLPLGSYKTNIMYTTPGEMYRKGYEIKYINQ